MHVLNNGFISMNEELNLDYINNYGIGEFNTELLMNLSEVANNKYLQLMELENADLPMLCPLLKALYYLGRSEFPDHVIGALNNIMIIDPYGTDRPTIETVNHVIKKQIGNHEVILEF